MHAKRASQKHFTDVQIHESDLWHDVDWHDFSDLNGRQLHRNTSQMCKSVTQMCKSKFTDM